MTSHSSNERGEMLVAIMNDPADLELLQKEHWYRIPKSSAPSRWPPQWLAFYQTQIFKEEAFAVRYYGRVSSFDLVPRRVLFPNEFLNSKSDKEYYRLYVDHLECLSRPILSRRLRRIVFIPTTLKKFEEASEINDLFDSSRLEDLLWTELKRRSLDAERQWSVSIGNNFYQLDFAFFCLAGRIDVETDGDTWHINKEQTPKDNARNNALSAAGWHILRFNTNQIREGMTEYCIPNITESITRLGGLNGQGIMPRTFYNTPEGTAEQLTLFEPPVDYDLD